MKLQISKNLRIHQHRHGWRVQIPAGKVWRTVKDFTNFDSVASHLRSRGVSDLEIARLKQKVRIEHRNAEREAARYMRRVEVTL